MFKTMADKGLTETKAYDIELIESLQTAMRNGEVKFTYMKRDGSERTAVGTLSKEIIPSESYPKSENERKQSDDILRYYDVDKEGWRSCIKENILRINE